MEVRARAKTGRVEGLSSLAEVLSPVAAGIPGPESAVAVAAGPEAEGVGEACGRWGWRISGEESSSCGGRATVPGAAFLARASRSLFSRSSSETVLGLGRGPHGAGGGACGRDSE